MEPCPRRTGARWPNPRRSRARQPPARQTAPNGLVRVGAAPGGLVRDVHDAALQSSQSCGTVELAADLVLVPATWRSAAEARPRPARDRGTGGARGGVRCGKGDRRSTAEELGLWKRLARALLAHGGGLPTSRTPASRCLLGGRRVCIRLRVSFSVLAADETHLRSQCEFLSIS